MKIRQKLIILLLVIAFIPTLTVSGISYVTISNGITAKTIEQLTSNAQKQQERINIFLQKTREDTNRLAGKYDLQVAVNNYVTAAKSDTRTTERIDKILSEKQAESSDIDSISLINLQGVVLASTTLGAEGRQVNHQDYDLAPGEHTRTFIKEDPVDSIKKLYVITEFTVDNKKIGILMTVYRLSELVATVKDYTGLGSSGETVVAIQDKNNNAVSLFPLRFDENAAFVTKLNSLHLFNSGDNFYMDVVDYRGKHVLIATKHIDETNWAMATKIDREEALSPITALRNVLIFILISSSIVIIFAAVYFARLFTSPIISLTQKTEKISQGDLNQQIEIKSSDEIGVLATAFNKMTSQLQQSYTELEKKVQQRTEQLSQKIIETEQQKAKDEAVLVSIGDGIIMTDREGKIALINHAAEILLGWKLNEVVGRMLSEVVTIEDDKHNSIAKDMRPITKTLSSGTKQVGTYYYQKRDSTLLPIALTVSPVVLDHTIIGAVEVFRDITHDKELEKMKDEFLSIASHELRTPMTAVKGLVSMILAGDYGAVNHELEEPLKDVSASTERLIHLVNDLLNVSRMEAGRVKYTLTSFNIVDPIKEIVNLLQPIAKHKSIALVAHDIQDMQVQADSDKVKQVLNNIIGNALKFTDTGSITVTTHEEKSAVIIYITDTGMGIAPEDQEKLFGKFQQISSQQAGKPQGTGLGLYISRELIRKMGGDLWIEKSEIGKGTTFAFSVPKTDSELAKGVKESIEKEATKTPDQKKLD